MTVPLTQERERDRRGRFSPDEGDRRQRRREWVAIEGKNVRVSELVRLSQIHGRLDELADALGVRPRSVSSQLAKLRASGTWVRLYSCGPPEGRKIAGYGEYQPVCDRAFAIACRWLGVSPALAGKNRHQNVLRRTALRVAVYLARVEGGVPLNAFHTTMRVHNLRAASYCSAVEELRVDPAFDALLSRLGAGLVGSRR